MDRIERLAVHVDEAVRLGEARDPAHLRLSLLLLDSAAELMLYRESSHRLAWEEIPRQMLARIEADEKQGRPLTSHQMQIREDLRTRVTLSADRRKIRRYFDAKAEFLRAAGVIPDPYVRCLRKLHKYRNEAYHEDDLRYGSLLSAVRIYTYIVCQMMRLMPPHIVSVSAPGQLPLGLQGYLSADDAHSLGAQARVADRILEGTRLKAPEEIGHELSEHLLNRLADVDDSLSFIADYLRDVRQVRKEGWDRADVLTLVQGEKQLSPFASLEDVRSITVPIHPSTIERWRSEAKEIAGEAEPLAAFTRFADIEDAFEEIEEKVTETALALDQEIQLQIDIARGK